jgi:hypothetical protein
MVAAQDMNANQLTRLPQAAGETAVSAVAAQVVASVQARYTVAIARPRNLDQVRVSLLNECRRPGFARVAIYNKPIGQGVTGPSIRFAEAALRCLGNVLPEVITVFDDADKRIVRVSVTDLEGNVTYSKDVTVTKTVERANAKGQEVVGQRVNSRGSTVYIVRASDDDCLNKENALVSKALRTVALRLIPGDILDEALDTVEETLRSKAAEDPAGERKRMVDAFASIGVNPTMLVAHLRHPLEQITPAELSKLRGVYLAIKDGEATWVDVTEADAEQAPEKPAESKSSRTKDALKARRESSQEPPHNATTGECYDFGPPPMSDEELAGQGK